MVRSLVGGCAVILSGNWWGLAASELGLITGHLAAADLSGCPPSTLTMETHHQPQQLNQRKTSVKRCLSPCSEADHEGHVLVSGVKRKTTDPSLLLVQSEYSTDLSQLDTQYKLMVDQRSRQQTDSDTTPTYDPGSPSSSLPSLPSLPTSSSECSQQITPHSSSYSSWTKPIQVTIHCFHSRSHISFTTSKIVLGNWIYLLISSWLKNFLKFQRIKTLIDNLFEINLFISQLASSNKKELKKEKLSILFNQY